MSILINAARKSISLWLSANGVDPKSWAPWVALNHYLSRKGTDLNLSGNEVLIKLAALAIQRQLQVGESTCCDYNTMDISMQTPTPYLGRYLQGRFNELTATVGGFSFTNEGEYYQIVDRYDWYDTGVIIDIPPCVRPLVDKAPRWAKQKLGLKDYTFNQGAMPMLGKAFNTVIQVPKELVERINKKDFVRYTNEIESDYTNSNRVPDSNSNWKDVFVADDDQNKDPNWSDYGKGRHLGSVLDHQEGCTVVVGDDLYGGFQQATPLCSLLSDIPSQHWLYQDESVDEHVLEAYDFLADGLYWWKAYEVETKTLAKMLRCLAWEYNMLSEGGVIEVDVKLHWDDEDGDYDHRDNITFSYDVALKCWSVASYPYYEDIRTMWDDVCCLLSIMPDPCEDYNDPDD